MQTTISDKITIVVPCKNEENYIHHAEIKEINGVMYMNDGDWVESCTALVEHWDGHWEIITWTKERDDVAIDTNSDTYKRPPGSTRQNRTPVSRSKDLRASPKHTQVAIEV